MYQFSFRKCSFPKIDIIILDFIWNKKPPRICKQFLQRPNALGGMALPNLWYYYWTANLGIIQFWLQFNTARPPRIWLKIEAASCLDLCVDNIFASFEQLSGKFGLPKQHLFRFFQIRSFVNSRFPQFPNPPTDSPLDTLLKPVLALKGMISYFFTHIHLLWLVSLVSIKALWELQLGEEISEELWEEALDRVHKSSICAKHGLIQCKIIHRAHFT